MRPRRRWFQFGLGTLFVAITLLAVFLGWQIDVVGRRATMIQWVEENGGYADFFIRPEPGPPEEGKLNIVITQYQRVLGPEKGPEIPRWRARFRDVPVNVLMLPAGSERELRRPKTLFPEAEVLVMPSEATAEH